MAGGPSTGGKQPADGGIYAARWTTLRFPAGTVVLTLERGELEVRRTEVGLDVWPHWLEIALQHSADATRAHEGLLSALAAQEEQGTHDALEHEFRSAMQSISAAAFVLRRARNHHRVAACGSEERERCVVSKPDLPGRSGLLPHPQRRPRLQCTDEAATTNGGVNFYLP